jgi:hypothetical protein
MDLVAALLLELGDLRLQKLDIVAGRIGRDRYVGGLRASNRKAHRDKGANSTLKCLHDFLLPSIL